MFKTNDYFDGKVKSIAYESIDGATTIGVMAAGEYKFNTSAKEYMTVTSGSMTIQLAGEEEWKTYKTYETFIVEANTFFNAKVNEDTSYKCVYK